MKKLGPRNLLLISLPMALALPLSSCTQRTVLDARQSYSIQDDQWGNQVGGGDVDKLKEKFAGGFELKDGEVVVTGNKKNPFQGKEFEIKEFDGGKTKEFGTSKTSEDGNKLFSGLRDFKVKPFDTGKPAREASMVPGYADQDAGLLSQTFETGEWNRANERYRTSKAPDSEKVFFGPKNATEQNARSANAKITQTTADLMNPNAKMSVDEVRKMLHPEKYE